MPNYQLIRTVLGIIGNITSGLLFASPGPTFWRIFKNKNVEGFHPYPYLAAVMNCAFWVFYAMPFNHPNSWPVLTINSLGLLLELVFLAIYFAYTDKKMRLKMVGILAGEAIFFSAVAVFDILYFHTHHSRSFFIGCLSVFFGLILYSSPASIMKKVIATKSSEYMPLHVILAGAANGLVWGIYAVMGQLDWFILISNGLGAVLAFAQLVLYFIYRQPKGKAAGKSSEVEMPETV